VLKPLHGVFQYQKCEPNHHQKEENIDQSDAGSLKTRDWGEKSVDNLVQRAGCLIVHLQQKFLRKPILTEQGHVPVKQDLVEYRRIGIERCNDG
jgi:hypothetical protein